MDETRICNMALGFLGANLVTNYRVDESEEAELCRVNFEISRRYCLEEADWTFASDMVVLSALADTPAFKYSRAFQLPSDCLVVRSVSLSSNMSNTLPYLKQNTQLYANAENLYIRYTCDEKNINVFSANAIFALAYKLASLMALPLTESRKTQETMEALTLRYLEKGGGIDGSQSRVAPFKTGKILTSRRTGIIQ